MVASSTIYTEYKDRGIFNGSKFNYLQSIRTEEELRQNLRVFLLHSGGGSIEYNSCFPVGSEEI